MAIREHTAGKIKHWKTGATILLAALCQAPCALNPTMRFDSDLMITDSEGLLREWESLGRFGLVAVKRLLGLTAYHPVRSGLLFLFFFALSLLLLTVFLQRCYGRGRTFPGLFLFLLLVGSCPVWAFQTYFNLQAAEIGLMLAACSLAAGLSVEAVRAERIRTKALLLVVSGLLLFLCLSGYQAFAVYYIAAVSMLLIVCLNGSATDLKPRSAAVLLPHLFAVVMLYLLISRQIVRSDGYLMQQMMWGKDSFAECLFNIIAEAGKMCLLFSAGQFSILPVGLILLALLFFSGEKGTKRRPLYLLCCLSLLAAPLLMSILFGNRMVPRMQLALPVTAAFLPSLYGLCRENGKHVSGRIFSFADRILPAVCVIFVAVQTLLGCRLAYTDYRRFLHDREFAEQVTTALEPYAEVQKPVVFLGVHGFPDDSVWLEKTDVYGNSFFEWLYDEAVPDSCDAGARRFLRYYAGREAAYADNALTGEMREEALRLLNEAGDGPATDVRVLEGRTVIALVMP